MQMKGLLLAQLGKSTIRGMGSLAAGKQPWPLLSLLITLLFLK